MANFTYDSDNNLLDCKYEYQTNGTGLHVQYNKALFHKQNVTF
jgi:hypothetical protein